MTPKVALLVAFAAFYILNIQALSLGKLEEPSSSEENNKVILESIKEFVKMVDKYNLNVSIIGSNKKYSSNDHLKESLSVTLHRPVNRKHYIEEATLDDAKQDKFLKKLSKKEHVGAKTRVIKIEDGSDQLANEESVNSDYIIQSPSYDLLISYTNGINEFYVSENETTQTVHNYLITNPATGKNKIANVQIITAQAFIEDKEVSPNFPATVLDEVKAVLPKLWMSIDDEAVLARILVEQLDQKFDDGNFQVAIGVDNFALGGNKPYANLQIANSNVLVFSL